MPPTKICDLEVPEFVTIDATTPNSALDAVRSIFPTAPPHKNIAGVVSNLRAQLNTNPETTSVMLIGHGLQGIIATGSGPKINDKVGTHIGSDNEGKWFKQLSNLSSLF